MMKNLPDLEFSLLTYPPESRKGEMLFEQFQEYTHRIALIKRSMNRSLELEEIESQLAAMPPSFYVPNYREVPHAAMIRAKRLGFINVFVVHGHHASYYRLAMRFQSVIDYFICPSTIARSTLSTWLPANRKPDVFYCPHAISQLGDLAPKPKNAVHQPIRLLYHGRIAYEDKNLDELVPIVEELNRRKFSFQLDIVGDGPDLWDLKAKLPSTSSGQVRFHGEVAQSALPFYFEAADLAVLVSSREGFCIGLAEAMLYGLPAIAYDCGGVINDFVKDGVNGFILPHGSTSAFANAVVQLGTDSTLYLRFSEAAHQFLSTNFHAARFCKNYETIFSRKPSLNTCRWPMARPKLPPDEFLSMPGLVENIGRRFFNWPVYHHKLTE